MKLQDLLSEKEAAAFSGVSVQTLNRFAEAGYLQVEVDGDGMRHFSQVEISQVFGLQLPPRKSAPLVEARPAPAQRPIPTPSVETGVETAATAPPAAASVPVQQPQIIRQPASASPPLADLSTQQPVLEHTTPQTQRLSDMLEIEVTKLRCVVSLQEKLLDMRDAQLKDLQDEREWLRSRVEKLDEKSDRDQLLLLSETQTIRKLVTHSQTQRSTFRSALEWLGVLEPQNALSSSPLIELRPNGRN